MKKGIKINVQTKKLEYVELADDYTDIYTNIGNGCKLFQVPYEFDNKDTIFIDEEICLRENDIMGGFMMENWRYPLLNNGIILGCDNEGNSIDCKNTIEELEDIIFFVPVEVAKKWARIVSNTPPKIYSF
jgi:hypothetical protein